MKQSYFIVVLAHSLHGRLRRIHVPQKVVYVVLALALFGCFSLIGFVSSYVRMAWKVANYNSLRQEAESLRARYQNLQRAYNQTNQQLAALQLFASEVSTAYGIKQKLEGPPDIAAEGRLVPTFSETLEEYNFLKSANFSKFRRAYAGLWLTNMRPSIWPVDGRLMGAFGTRNDPFSGEQSFHTGVDIGAPYGEPVRATADGIVSHSEYSGGYGRLVIVDHGGGVQTYYAHLSRISVIAGQAIRRGEIVGALGGSGRATAPHLHYEVRVGGNPINPYNFLAKAPVAETAKKDFPF
jgi:murein DD-endopeptidase MepM/ murein hydrolase activator NlpD